MRYPFVNGVQNHDQGTYRFDCMQRVANILFELILKGRIVAPTNGIQDDGDGVRVDPPQFSSNQLNDGRRAEIVRFESTQKYRSGQAVSRPKLLFDVLSKRRFSQPCRPVNVQHQFCGRVIQPVPECLFVLSPTISEIPSAGTKERGMPWQAVPQQRVWRKVSLKASRPSLYRVA